AGGYTVNNGILQATGATTAPTAASLLTLGRASSADVDVSANLAILAANGLFGSVVARYTGSNDTTSSMYLATDSFANGVFSLSIQKRSNGVTTTLASVPLPGSGNGTLELKVVGGQLQLLFNGTLELTVFDFSLTAGSVGVRSTPGASFLSFS